MIDAPKHLYIYQGSVTQFGKVICPYWEGTTSAVSPHRAHANLLYQYKVLNNLRPTARVSFTNKVRCIDDDDD